MLEILIILIILVLFYNNSYLRETFNASNNGIGSSYYLDYKPMQSPFQIGKIHTPDYNYPIYGRQYPYYNYFFNPYNTSIY